jgi:hypothetical protein
MAKDIDKHNLPKMQETLSTIVLSNVYLFDTRSICRGKGLNMFVSQGAFVS